MSSWFDDVMPPGEEAQAEGVRPAARRPGQDAEVRPNFGMVQEPAGPRLKPRPPPPPEQRLPHPSRPAGDGGFFSGGHDAAQAPLNEFPEAPTAEEPFIDEPTAEEPTGEGAFFSGDGTASAEAFVEESPQQEPAGGETGDGGFFSAEADPFEVPIMAGIEREREAHQRQRDKTYDVIDSAADVVGNVGSVVGVVHSKAGEVINGVSGAFKLATKVGGKLGEIIDESYDNLDANRHKEAEKINTRLRDQVAKDRIDRQTPKGFIKPTT